MTLRRQEKHKLSVSRDHNVSFVIESRGLWQEWVKKEICFQYTSKSTVFVRQLDLNQSNVNWNTMDSVTPAQPFHS